MTKCAFVLGRKWFKNWEHFDYHFSPIDEFTREDEDILYDWCLYNLIDIGGW